MKNLLPTLLILSLTSCIPSSKEDSKQILSQGIFGTDDRVEVDSVYGDNLTRAVKATAAMIDAKKIIEKGDKITIPAPTAKERFGLCGAETFSKQPSAASCSGFLIAPDIVMTAGHCLIMDDVCTNFKWIFNYEYSSESGTLKEIYKSDVYGCKKIIAVSYSTLTKEDYGILQLDRLVMNIEPIKLRLTFPKLRKSSELFIVGHPMGQPKKIAEGGEILDNSNKLFIKTNLDALSGNSGSPVFNKASGQVEGIFVRGTGYELYSIPYFDGTAEGSTCNVYRKEKYVGDEELKFTSEVMRVNKIEGLKKLLKK